MEAVVPLEKASAPQAPERRHIALCSPRQGILSDRPAQRRQLPRPTPRATSASFQPKGSQRRALCHGYAQIPCLGLRSVPSLPSRGRQCTAASSTHTHLLGRQIDDSQYSDARTRAGRTPCHGGNRVPASRESTVRPQQGSWLEYDAALPRTGQPDHPAGGPHRGIRQVAQVPRPKVTQMLSGRRDNSLS